MRSFVRMQHSLGVLLLLALISGVTIGQAGEWNQWRGPERSGAAAPQPVLISELPQEGIKPVWMSEGPMHGGWASPIVSSGRVLLYSHERRRRADVKLPPPEFPVLDDEQKSRLTEQQLRDYEEKRVIEILQRQKQAFTLIDTVTCFDAETGSTLWRQTWPGQVVRWGQSSTPAAVNGVVYVVGSDRKLHALDLSSGAQHWATSLKIEEEMDLPIASSVIVIDGVAILLAERLIGIDVATGDIIWEQGKEAFGGVFSSAAAWESGEGAVAVVNVSLQGGETVAVRAKTGEELWRLKTGADKSSPVVVGDRLLTYAHSRKGGLRCYQLSTDAPQLLWTVHRAADPGASPLVLNDQVFVAGDKLVTAVSLADGDLLWTERLDLAQSKYSSPIGGGESVYYLFDGLWAFTTQPDAESPVRFSGRFDGQGLLADEEYFRRKFGLDELERTVAGQQRAAEIWQKEIVNHGPVDCTSPALADGRLYVRLRSGLACYDLRKDQIGKDDPRVSMHP